MHACLSNRHMSSQMVKNEQARTPISIYLYILCVNVYVCVFFSENFYFFTHWSEPLSLTVYPLQFHLPHLPLIPCDFSLPTLIALARFCISIQHSASRLLSTFRSIPYLSLNSYLCTGCAALMPNMKWKYTCHQPKVCCYLTVFSRGVRRNEIPAVRMLSV